jgi:transcriptional regulator with XRE-family HTH domain
MPRTAHATWRRGREPVRHRPPDVTVDAVPIGDVVLDMAIYPRDGWSQPTVERYAEALKAGDQFPPIMLEEGTNRLLDGMHRYQAHMQLGLAEIRAEHRRVPEGEPPLLYAATLSARHGDRITGKDMQRVTRQVATDHPDYPMVKLAKMLGVTRQTVSKWASDITERRRDIRKVKALLLDRAGWSLRQIGDFLSISKDQVSTDVNDDITRHLSEDILREALEGLPEECVAIAEEIREERIFASWSDEERELLKRLRAGETVVVSMRTEGHPNLYRWAEDADLFVRIDRKSDWGNPFEMPGDGDRETVIARYADHYLPYKPSLLSRLGELHGKALGCWCAPESCHGDVLKAEAER